MIREFRTAKVERGLGSFERYLTVWVLVCIATGILLGKLVARSLPAQPPSSSGSLLELRWRPSWVC